MTDDREFRDKVMQFVGHAGTKLDEIHDIVKTDHDRLNKIEQRVTVLETTPKVILGWKKSLVAAGSVVGAAVAALFQFFH